jgi:hypothetical protein
MMKRRSSDPEIGLTRWEKKNLLFTFPGRKNDLVSFLRRPENWKIVSGSWTSAMQPQVRLNGEGTDGQIESMAVIGRRDWSNIELRVRFKFLSDTMRPPDGGAIVFFLARNRNNHMAFHFCMGKDSIQLFKKVHGIWAMVGETRFEFQLNRQYAAEIRSGSGIHRCLMEDGTCLQANDPDISRGCIGIGGKFCIVEFDWLSVSAA